MSDERLDSAENPTFRLCEACLPDYQALRWDDAAEKGENLLPLGTIVWSDEHPKQSEERYRPWLCEEGCRDTVVRLVAARCGYWRDEVIPSQFQHLWDEAQHQIPDWPGFQRLYLSPEDRHAIEEWEKQSAEEFEAFLGEADQVEMTENADGLVSFSMTFKVDEEDETAAPASPSLWTRAWAWMRRLV